MNEKIKTLVVALVISTIIVIPTATYDLLQIQANVPSNIVDVWRPLFPLKYISGILFLTFLFYIIINFYKKHKKKNIET